MVKNYINRLLNLPKNLVELRVQVERFCRFYTARHLYAFIREIDMEKKTQNGLLIAGGFLLGTLGVKALCPDTAKMGMSKQLQLACVPRIPMTKLSSRLRPKLTISCPRLATSVRTLLHLKLLSISCACTTP